MSLSFEVISQDETIIFKMFGKIITDNEVQQLEEELFPLLSQNLKRILFNLSGLTHINSTGISFFMKTLTKARILGGELILVGLSGNVEKVFEIAKLNEVFTIYVNSEEGLAHFKA